MRVGLLVLLHDILFERTKHEHVFEAGGMTSTRSSVVDQCLTELQVLTEGLVVCSTSEDTELQCFTWRHIYHFVLTEVLFVGEE